jgi:hypothetical protein
MKKLWFILIIIGSIIFNGCGVENEIVSNANTQKSTNDTVDVTKEDTKTNTSSEKTVEKFDELENVPALELVEALCLSEVLHYDSFISEPDEITTTYTLYNLVSAGNFRWDNILTIQDGAYYFNDGLESETADDENNTCVSPNELYQDYFVCGEYKYPPQELSMFIEGTQTGIAVHLSDLPYGVDVKVNDVQQIDDKTIITATISRSFYDGTESELLGDAIITLKEEVNSCYFEYKIVSYEPEYDEFKDIELK